MTGMTLAESCHPEDLVPGNPSRLRTIAESFLSAWQVCGGAVPALEGLRVEAWSGTAADAFHDAVNAEVRVLTSTVPSLLEVHSAIDAYVTTLLTARADASELADRYRRSVNRSAQAQEDHDAACRRAWLNSDIFGVIGEAFAEFFDPGITDRIGMDIELRAIQRRVKNAGDQAAEIVRACASAAPIPQPAPTVGGTITDAIVGWATGAYTAVSDVVVGTGEFLWAISPVRAISDLVACGPEGFIAGRLNEYGQVVEVASTVVADPGAAGAALVGDFFAAEMWAQNPARALGTVQANIGMLLIPGSALTKLGAAGKITGRAHVPVIRGTGDSVLRIPEHLPERHLTLPEASEISGSPHRPPGSGEGGPNIPKLIPPGDVPVAEAAVPPFAPAAPGARPIGRTERAHATLAPRGTLPPQILTPNTFPTVKVMEAPGARTPFVRRRTVLEPHTHYEVLGRGNFFTDARGKVFQVDAEFRSPGGHLNPDLMHPLPNVVYNVGDRFTYTTDSLSRTIRMQLRGIHGNEPGVRSSYVTRKVGKEAGPDYHGGHLAAHGFGGGSELINVVGMRKLLNLNYRSMPGLGKPSFGNLERKLDALAKGPPPKHVDMDVQVRYSDASKVPDGFDVEYRVEGGRLEREEFVNTN